ncbi:MAG: hypothetical protein OQK04_10495 [Kangiellaceae bacterium]|nr:hypothetical protein [Kangiellaceae bacterium]
MIRDENNLGKVYNELKLSFDKVEVTVKDIITERVYQEVSAYNERAKGYENALVQPKDAEIKLNEPSKKGRRPVNAEKQVEVALAAFDNNGFFMLVDDQQAENLDDIVTIKPETSVSFIKLTPLVGG